MASGRNDKHVEELDEEDVAMQEFQLKRSSTYTDAGLLRGEAEFGDRLSFNLHDRGDPDKTRFRAEYDYRRVIQTAFSCNGRAFPWQTMLMFLCVNVTVAMLTIFNRCEDWDGNDVTESFYGEKGCTKFASSLDTKQCHRAGCARDDKSCQCKWIQPGLHNKWKLPMNPKYIYLVVAFLLVFRAQQAYAYYRDARANWAIVIYNCWECYQLMTAHIKKRSLVRAAGQHLIAFAICLKGFLRRETQTLEETKRELNKVLTDEDAQRLMSIPTGNLSAGIRGEDVNRDGKYVTQHGHLQACMHVVRRCLEHGMNDNKQHNTYNLNMHVWANRRMSDLSKAVCDMHRISTTPFPWIYMLHLRLVLYIYLVLMPFAIRDYCFTGPAKFPKDEGGNPKGSPKFPGPETAGYIILFSSLVDYVFLGLEEVANELQNPFGTDVSDLPMEDFIQQIQRFLSHTAHVVYNVYDQLDERLLGLPDNETDSADRQARRMGMGAGEERYGDEQRR